MIGLVRKKKWLSLFLFSLQLLLNIIMLDYPKAELSTALSIDEFKGNTNGEKYQCILTDPVNKVVLDILPERYKPYFTYIFSSTT